MRLTILFVCICLAGCAALGPVSSPEFGVLVRTALPAGAGKARIFGPGFWYPNTRGFTDLRSLGLARPQEPVPGVLVVTRSALFVEQWDKPSNRYRVVKRFLLTDTQGVSLDSYGRGRRVVVQWKDFSTDSFSFTSDGGQMIDVSKTEALFTLLSSDRSSN
jgi:hypothetical protein